MSTDHEVDLLGIGGFRALEALGLEPGRLVFAQIKGVSLLASGAAARAAGPV